MDEFLDLGGYAETSREAEPVPPHGDAPLAKPDIAGHNIVGSTSLVGSSNAHSLQPLNSARPVIASQTPSPSTTTASPALSRAASNNHSAAEKRNGNAEEYNADFDDDDKSKSSPGLPSIPSSSPSSPKRFRPRVGATSPLAGALSAAFSDVLPGKGESTPRVLVTNTDDRVHSSGGFGSPLQKSTVAKGKEEYMLPRLSKEEGDYRSFQAQADVDSDALAAFPPLPAGRLSRNTSSGQLARMRQLSSKKLPVSVRKLSDGWETGRQSTNGSVNTSPSPVRLDVQSSWMNNDAANQYKSSSPTGKSISALQQRVETLSVSMNELRMRAQIAEERVQEYKTKLEKAGRHDVKQAELENQKRERDMIISKQLEELRTVVAQNRTLSKQLDALTSDQDSAPTRAAQLASELRVERNRVRLAREECEKLKEQINRQQDAIVQLNQSNKRLKNDVAAAGSELSTSKKMITQLQTQLSKASASGGQTDMGSPRPSHAAVDTTNDGAGSVASGTTSGMTGVLPAPRRVKPASVSSVPVRGRMGRDTGPPKRRRSIKSVVSVRTTMSQSLGPSKGEERVLPSNALNPRKAAVELVEEMKWHAEKKHLLSKIASLESRLRAQAKAAKSPAPRSSPLEMDASVHPPRTRTIVNPKLRVMPSHSPPKRELHPATPPPPRKPFVPRLAAAASPARRHTTHKSGVSPAGKAGGMETSAFASELSELRSLLQAQMGQSNELSSLKQMVLELQKTVSPITQAKTSPRMAPLPSPTKASTTSIHVPATSTNGSSPRTASKGTSKQSSPRPSPPITSHAPAPTPSLLDRMPVLVHVDMDSCGVMAGEVTLKGSINTVSHTDEEEARDALHRTPSAIFSVGSANGIHPRRRSSNALVVLSPQLSREPSLLSFPPTDTPAKPVQPVQPAQPAQGLLHAPAQPSHPLVVPVIPVSSVPVSDAPAHPVVPVVPLSSVPAGVVKQLARTLSTQSAKASARDTSRYDDDFFEEETSPRPSPLSSPLANTPQHTHVSPRVEAARVEAARVEAGAQASVEAAPLVPPTGATAPSDASSTAPTTTAPSKVPVVQPRARNPFMSLGAPDDSGVSYGED